MKFSSALLGGLAGATVLTLIHETVRRVNKDAPRMDLLGMEAISKTLHKVDVPVPEERALFNITMAGDILSNTIYYSLIAIAKKEQAVMVGGLLGAAAGLGGVYLPKPMGLHDEPSSRTTETQLLTITWYLVGGLVAGLTTKLIEQGKG